MFRTSLLRTTAFAGVFAAVSVGASAQTAVNGGGATLPQPTYTAEFPLISALNPSINFTYAGVGSGGGQKAFLKNAPSVFSLPAGTSVAFGASDAALTTAEVGCWTGSTTSDEGTDCTNQQATAGNLIKRYAKSGWTFRSIYNAQTSTCACTYVKKATPVFHFCSSYR